MRSDHVRVKPRARLRRSLLRGVIDMYDAKALGVAETPLVVVEQRPREVAAEVDALAKRLVRRRQMRSVVRDAQRIVDATVDRLRRVVERRAIFGDVQRNAPVTLRHP